MNDDYIPENAHIYTVSEINREARALIEGFFQSVWVEGEISNFSCPSSGHWYFSLKDETAQIRCAMFRNQQRSVKFQPEDGMHVFLRAKGSIYENRGEFQLIIDRIEEIGLGSLQRKFEQLKQKLAAEGLFDEQYKKPIPTFPKTIGVITSATGAAVKDVINTLERRYPLVKVLIYPTMVQGDLAANMIVEAIEKANNDHLCDTLLLVRGGGSLEDLWCFNEEIVAKAVFKSEIPIICGVGHEIDFTIADFVADLRAPTPTAAAELACPDRNELIKTFESYKVHLERLLLNRLNEYQQQLDFLEKRLLPTAPLHKIQRHQERLQHLNQQLQMLQNQQLERLKLRLDTLSKNLLAIDPKALLKRGYSIITNKNGEVIYSIKDITIGERISALVSDGNIQSTIEKMGSDPYHEPL